MRYELRRWINPERTEYVVRQTSDDLTAIKSQLQRVQTASTEPPMNFIVDTESTIDD
jgi:hypothetical protein